ncbi:MAG: ABC transporter permease [Anaerolineae bacterium]|nr:ABC transporter permease [Anaerolineae bacterium]
MMFEQIRFYLSHSFNDLRVNKRLTFFALLSVAAGVAAIVSLQTLALMISETLESNLQETNRGDVAAILAMHDADEPLVTNDSAETASDEISETDNTVSDAENTSNSDLPRTRDEAVEAGIIAENEFTIFGQSQSEYKLSQSGVEAIEAWIADSIFAGQIETTYRAATSSGFEIFTGTGKGASITDTESGNQASQLSSVVVDTAVYPFYSDVVTTDGQTLASVMQNPTDIVVGDSVAEQLDLEVGDTVQINGSSATFTVRGIAKAENEVKNFNTDFFAGVFGFYYLDWSALDLFDDLPIQAEAVYFKMADASQVTLFGDGLLDAFPYLSLTTTEDLREDNEELTQQIDSFVAVMGLISLLLGSIGIINTMQVVVRRRMLEIAVLKTLGLQSDQITILFLTQAFLVGIIGSLAGILLGWVGTFALKGVVANIFASDIPFMITPLPAINGFAVGVVVATVFGFLPTLTAGQVRPGTVLRPAQGVIPSAGILRSLAALTLIIMVVTVIVEGIIDRYIVDSYLSSFGSTMAKIVGLVDSYLWALGGVIVAFIAVGIIYLLLVLLIWIIGRFTPTFGFVDLKISLRQMLVSKNRGASTLLALVVGVFSLSTITLFAQSIANILDVALSSAGGNVIVSVQNYNQVDELEALISGMEGVNDYTAKLAYQVEFVSYASAETGETYDTEAVRQRVRDSDIDFPPFFNGTAEEKDADGRMHWIHSC